MVGPAAKRDAVAHLRKVLGMSERRACTLVAADRKMIRYQSRRPPDIELRSRLRDLANQRRRFGYRRLFILLREQGEPSGINRIYRLYREEGLTVRKRKARRRAIGTRTPILVEARVNARWSLDFVHDQFARGRRFRILNIVDDVTRECLAVRKPQEAERSFAALHLGTVMPLRSRPNIRPVRVLENRITAPLVSRKLPRYIALPCNREVAATQHTTVDAETHRS